MADPSDMGTLKEGEDSGDVNIESLEKDFRKVLDEIMQDDNLEKFRGEYEKLSGGLVKSKENERRLMTKCRDLKADIAAHAAKLQEVTLLNHDDKNTIAALKKELDKAWRLVDAGAEKETLAQETIDTLQEQITELNKLVEDKGALGIGSECSVQDLLDIKDNLTKELASKTEEMVQTRTELSMAIAQQKEEEKVRDEAEQTIAALREEIKQSHHETQRELHRKRNLEHEVAKLQRDMQVKATEVETMVLSNSRTQEISKILEDQIRELESGNERAREMLESQRTHSNGIQQKLEDQIDAAENLRRDREDQSQLLKAREEELRSIRHEQNRTRQLRDALNGKLQQADKDKMEMERQKDDLKAQIAGLERELDQQRKMTDMKGKKCDELTRERDKLDRQIRLQRSVTERQTDLVKVHAQGQKTLESELANYQEEAAKQRKAITDMERERDAFFQEVGAQVQHADKLNELLKVKEIQIIDCKKQLADAEAKRKQQQNLYEAVRSDRNMFSKSLQEKQDELKEIRRKVLAGQRLIEQLKDDVAGKDTALVKEHAEHQKLEKDKENLRSELGRLKDEVREASRFSDQQQLEHERLQRILAESDSERRRQKKALDQILNERDVLGTQLTRRNDELFLLHEKLKLQQNTLDKGEIEYTQRLADIKVLRLAIKRARQERVAMGKNVANFDELKQEVFRTQRELVRERTRCKALEVELQNPLNVHRWRKLQGSDPSKFELISKVQALQRKLISKTEEVVEKELQIKDKEKLYVELKQVLSRQPGPEVEQQVLMYQQTLKSKTKQLKAMAAELNMFEAQMNEAKMEGERLSRELQDVKKRYFMMKKKEQSKREREVTLSQGSLPPIQPNAKPPGRFTGGGFNMKPSSQSRIVQ